MNTIKWLIEYWKEHGTKILGTVNAIIGGLSIIPNLISAAHQPYWTAAAVILSALTVQRGFTNGKDQEKNS